MLVRGRRAGSIIREVIRAQFRLPLRAPPLAPDRLVELASATLQARRTRTPPLPKPVVGPTPRPWSPRPQFLLRAQEQGAARRGGAEGLILWNLVHVHDDRARRLPRSVRRSRAACAVAPAAQPSRTFCGRR